jgi:prepilin-type N-terminal cleavage/methylation domain-containing protein
MKTRAQNHQQGFTMVELLVVIAIVAILYGLLLSDAQKVRKAAVNMEQYPHLAGLAAQIEDFTDAQTTNAQQFVLSLGTDAANASSDNAVVNLDSLRFFCDADTESAALENNVNELLADPLLPDIERRLLTDTKNAMDVESPVMQKLDEVLRSDNGTAVCGGTIQ